MNDLPDDELVNKSGIKFDCFHIFALECKFNASVKLAVIAWANYMVFIYLFIISMKHTWTILLKLFQKEPDKDFPCTFVTCNSQILTVFKKIN